MLNWRLVIGLVACTALLGCAQKPQMRMSQFDPAEYEPFDRPGTGVVEGQAFLRTMAGTVRTGAGLEVVLNPVTSASTEVYERSVKQYVDLEPGDERASRFTRRTLADADGRFRFEGLPTGEYYIWCAINWHVSEYQQTGGIAHAKVTVQDGQVTRAIVTR